ncbi:MAG: OmpA family protein [Chitinophagales bacterium]
MAFDLNKSGSDKKRFDLTKSDGTTAKFDLSKGQGSPTIKTIRKSKSIVWIGAFLVVGMLAFVAWYFTSHTPSANTRNETVAQTSSPTESNGKLGNVDTTKSLKAITTNAEANTPITANSNSMDPSATSSSAANSKNSTAPNGPTSNQTVLNPTSLNNKIPVTFEYASASFNSVDDKLVSDLITYLSSNPSARVTINGYASSDGLLSKNLAIAQQRADSFKNYLVSKGIAAEKIIAVGKGIEKPIASNETEEGRKKNRRVETVFQ